MLAGPVYEPVSYRITAQKAALMSDSEGNRMRSLFAGAGVVLILGIAMVALGSHLWSGYLIPGFPAYSAIELLDIRDSVKTNGLKDHGWKLFRSIAGTGLNAHPLWDTWCGVGKETQEGMELICPDYIEAKGAHGAAGLMLSEAPLSEDAVQARIFRTFRQPRQLTLREAAPTLDALDRADSGQNLELSQVLYDPQTAQTVIDCFGDQGGGRVLYDKNNHQILGLKSFPILTKNVLSITKRPECQDKSSPKSFGLLAAQSIAIKTVWAAAVSTGIADSEGHEWSSQTDVWMGSCSPQNGTIGRCFQPAVIDIGPASQKEKCIDLPSTFTAGSTPAKIPLHCFYSFRIPQDRFNELIQKLLIKIKNDPGAPSTNNAVYMILLGFHVATKEIPDWTWQTYWWSGSSLKDENGYALQRAPTSVGSGVPDERWNRYVMSTTFGLSAKRQRADASSSPTSAVYNPYLEDDFPKGAQSNCVSCHTFAVLHASPTTGSLICNSHNYQDIASRAALDPTTCTLTKPQSDIYFSGVRTDFLWSLASLQSNPVHLAGETDFEVSIERLLEGIEKERGKININHYKWRVPIH
jgi:hypothetical protein